MQRQTLNNGQDHENDIKKIKKDIIMRIATAINEKEDKDGKVLVEIADKTGKLLKKKNVTVTKLRKIFNEVRNIKLEDNDCFFKISMLKAKLAYAAGRFTELRDFYDIVVKFIDEIGNDELRLKRFKHFFEAVVAYDRYYTKKE